MNPEIIAKHTGTRIVTAHGVFWGGAYRTRRGRQVLEHLLLYKELTEPVPLRIQSGCLFGDLFGDLQCDCSAQLQSAMRAMQQSGSGLVIYTPGHDGRGRGTLDKLRVYSYRQRHGGDSLTACRRLGLPYESRDYSAIPLILADLKIAKVVLLSRDDAKRSSLEQARIEVAAVRPLV